MSAWKSNKEKKEILNEDGRGIECMEEVSNRRETISVGYSKKEVIFLISFCGVVNYQARANKIV